MTSVIKSVIKYGVAFVLLALILHLAGVERVAMYLRQIPLLQWVVGLICVTVAQLVSAYRLQYFFRAAGFVMNDKFAIILSYVGAFYNFLLPGGIGGDAYKVIIARKRMEMPAVQGIRLMLADRASGLCIVMIFFSLSLSLEDFSSLFPYTRLLILLAIPITLIAYVLFSGWLCKLPPSVMLRSLSYSCLAQMLWISALLAIWSALSDGHYLVEYIALYCAAGIAGMLPISPGGLGIKEMTYFYGASIYGKYAHLEVNPQLGVTLSLCLFVMMFIASLPGLLWLEKAGRIEYS